MNSTNDGKTRLPVVEIFSSVEGEGVKAGFPTTFIRLFGCNLRCNWCDTGYSYDSSVVPRWYSIREIFDEVKQYSNKNICLTGGEPLLYGNRTLNLITKLAELENIADIHVETNGAVNLRPFSEWRLTNAGVLEKLRFIMDFKLLSSGESEKMIYENFLQAENCDELKFVIANDEDFFQATKVLKQHLRKGIALFSPVWGRMSPQRLVSLMLEHGLDDVKLNLQLQKIIWESNVRGV